MADLNTWFDQGISLEEYTNKLTDHEENFNHIYHTFDMPDDEEFFRSLENSGLRALVIAEPWCGHCMMDVPILTQLAEKSHMDVSVCLRDDNLELMDQYQTDGKRVIPIFIFIDKDGDEVAKWGPRAPEVTEYQKNLTEDMPEKGTEEYDEVFKEKIKELGARFSTDDTLWLAVYKDIKKTVEPRL